MPDLPDFADPKIALLFYLQRSRAALVWKLDGLSDYDVRRPMTPTGTNLLGLVKHLAYLEFGYLGDTFDRPSPVTAPFTDDDPNADMYATADESRADILDLYARGAAHADATVAALPLDARGHVPWWSPDRAEVTLHRILVHMIDETARHLGQADIVRETIDSAVGVREGQSNLPPDLDWPAYVARLDEIARSATG